ncbi:MAG: ArnT family glycosyltransferase [Ardenticatenaceae bacterium]
MSTEHTQTPPESAIEHLESPADSPSSMAIEEVGGDFQSSSPAPSASPWPLGLAWPIPPFIYQNFALFLIFFALSMLAWSGTFHSSDGLSMYTVSDSLARYGRWNTEQIRWMGIQQGNIGPDGLLYSRKGVATSLLALPFVWLGHHLPYVGSVHMALLLTPLIHALTALYLFHTIQLVTPAIGRQKALWVTILWAFCSMALAYVKTFFSEPAVTLAMVGALYHLVRFREGHRELDAAALGGWLGFSLVTRSANAIVFPLFGLALLAYAYEHYGPFIMKRRPTADLLTPLRSWQRWVLAEWTLRRLFAFVIPIVLGGLFYLWYNWLRTGEPFNSGYIEGEEFSAIWWQGVLGLTISPGRGLFWYTPWLPIVFFGARRLWERERVLVGVTVGSVLLYILVYGKWYLWSGGSAWGSRFLVPILPFLAFLVAPILEPVQRRRAPLLGGWPTAVWFTGVLGFMINLIGVLWDFDLHQQALEGSVSDAFGAEVFFEPRYAQIVGLLKLGLQTEGAIDLAWMVDGVVVWPLFALSLAIALAGLGAGSWGWRKQSQREVLQAGTLLSVLALWFLLVNLRTYQSPSRQDALRLLPDSPPPETQLWYDDPSAAEVIMNQIKVSLPITGFFVEGPELRAEEAPRAQALAENANAPIYLISDGPEQQQNGLDLLLLDHLFWIGERNNERYRVAEYWNGPLSDPIAYHLPLAFPDGATVTLHETQVTSNVSEDRIVAFLAKWETEQQLPENYQIFVHLYNEAGEIVLRKDSPPAQGRAHTTNWQPAQPIIDRHAFRLPDELPPGNYTIHFGMYRLTDLARATAADGQNEIVIPLQVQSSEE